MKNDKGFTTMWVWNKGEQPRRISVRSFSRSGKRYEVFGRFQSDGSDRVYRFDQCSMAEPTREEPVPAKPIPEGSRRQRPAWARVINGNGGPSPSL